MAQARMESIQMTPDTHEPASWQLHGQANPAPPLKTAGQRAVSTSHQREATLARRRAQCDMARLSYLAKQESAAFSKQHHLIVMVQPIQKKEFSDNLARAASDISLLNRSIGKFYRAARDVDRTRQFLRLRLRVLDQYEDGDKMQALKGSFSISPEELDQWNHLVQGMIKEVDALGTPPKSKTVEDEKQPPQHTRPRAQQPSGQLSIPDKAILQIEIRSNEP